MKGRVVFKGSAEGEALVSKDSISFYGGVDENGVVVAKDHDLEGKDISGKVLVFPTGIGSTVGSWTLYRLKKDGHAPVALVCEKAETVVAVGAIVSEIPMVDQIDISKFKTGQKLKVDGDNVE